MLKILTAPNPLLAKSVEPVTRINELIKRLTFEMEKTLVAQNDPPGVGLAAPQIGKNLALFIIKNSKKAKTMVFINPKIIKSEIQKSSFAKALESKPKSKKVEKKAVKLEGCLSIPRIWGPVKRSYKILVRYQNLSGKNEEKWFSGLNAVIIQHEMDHLKGVLFTERALQQNQPLYQEERGKLVKLSD